MEITFAPNAEARLSEIAGKASIDVSDLRQLLAVAAREKYDTGDDYVGTWIEALSFETVVIAHGSTFTEFRYTVAAGAVELIGEGTDVLRTFEPVEDFTKTAEAAHFYSPMRVKVGPNGERLIEGWASIFNTIDRDGEKMLPGAFKTGLSAFKSAPAMLYQHGRDPAVGKSPIGHWTVVEERAKGLWVEGEFAAGDEHADRIWNLAEAGHINALSVGGQRQFLRDGKSIARWDLVEISVTAVPSNAFATFEIVKDAPELPLAMFEAQRLETELAGVKSASTDGAMDTVRDALSGLSSALAEIKSVIDGGRTPAAELVTGLQPRMDFAVKALSEGETDMGDVDVKAAVSEAMAESAKEMGTAIATAVVDGMAAREDARAEAAAKEAEATKAQEERDTSIAEKAIEKFREEAKAKGFEMMAAGGAVLPMGEKDLKGAGGDAEPMTPEMIKAVAKYDRLSIPDLCYLTESRKAIHFHTQPGRPWVASPQMLQSLAVKSAQAWEKGDLPADLGATIHEKWIDASGENSGGGDWGGKEMLAPWAVKADELMMSTLASYGDEWVPTLWSASLWDRIRGTNEVVKFLAGAGQVIDMPSDPWIVPLEGADPTVVLAAQAEDAAHFEFAGATATSSRPTTAQVSMTTKKLMVLTPFARELEEDTIIPLIPQLRSQTELAMENAIENVVINGDTTTGATSNINDIGGTPGGTERWLVADGLRHLGLITTTADSVDIGTLTLAKFRKMRSLMGTGGKMGIRPSNLMAVMDGQVHFQMLDLDEVVTEDKFGPSATVKTGGLPALDQVRLHASEEMVLANTAGKVDLDTATNNVGGTLVIFNRRQFRLGYRRRLQMQVERVPFSDGGYLVASLRMAFQARDTEGVAVGYNVNV